ncbi:MAG TPA: hypothetical protein VHW69_17760 [Rhizomicrobium sp.]|jgi:uncharacterized lipoprotein NlpE involved in copper resistance|nr:hypothetical protein [Rhizomicrobium sp.]
MRISFPVLILGVMLALVGCDQKNSANVTVRDKDGSVTISANGQQFAMHGHDGAQGEVTISGNGGNFTVHAGDGKSVVVVNAAGVNVGSKLPTFVSIYPGAKVVSTMSGGDSRTGGGTVTFVSNAAPAAVIGFYRQKTASAGFRQNLDANDNGSLLYSATSGNRTVQVLASSDGSGTHAQITWSGR